MNAQSLTGLTGSSFHPVTRKANRHAVLTGLTGLTGLSHAHVCDVSIFFNQENTNKKVSRVMSKYPVNPVNPVNANKHAGFIVTGLVMNPVRPC